MKCNKGNCKNEAVAGLKLCEKHRNQAKESQERKRARLREQRICYKCNKEKPIGFNRKCETCRNKVKCKDCGDEALEGMTLCEKHLKLRRVKNKKKRDRLKESGLCSECGKEPAMENYRKCKECYDKKEIIRMSRVNARLNNNCCASCGRSKDHIKGWDYRYCAGCHLKEKFKFTGTKEEAEDIINSILIKQNYLCPLTGESLIENKFHIDHIIPKSVRPDLCGSPENWQIILADANFFKSNKTCEDLLSLCLKIVKHAIKNGKISSDDILV